VTTTEALALLWFGVSVGCILLAWIKGGWVAGVSIFCVCLIVGYVMGVIA
jgi:hypothetical protein